ncbi:MAG: arginine decarboxylase [Phototrophicales bacterium]|nr:MAG: arginine decarboxylase [Phototrophicales bacterium]
MNYDQMQMPFLESLLQERDRWATSFHMPGHKGTLSLPPLLESLIGDRPFSADIVSINDNIDYLHNPQTTLAQAQQLAAEAYGADHTFFLINGSTVGNIAAVMSTTSDKQAIVMMRSSHRSVYSGVVLSGAMPIYIEPEYHPLIGSPLAARPDVIHELLQKHRNVAAVHITSPNYYGVLSDTAQIASIAHQYEAALLVDEAHGSHLHFHPDLPASATQLGADIIVQSTHKTQGALTQCSMLHVNDGIVNVGRVGQVLAVLQTSSPSSILLASLDASRMQMATEGRAKLDDIIPLAQWARQQIQAIDGLWCYGDDLLGIGGVYAYDPTKLIIRVTDIGYNGYEAYAKLRNEHGIDCEFSDLRQVICSLTIGDNEASITKLVNAFRVLASEKRPLRSQAPEVAPPAGLPTIALSPRDAYYAPSRSIPIEQAIGEVVAENIIPYPPGIPLLVPGEIIEQQHLDYMRYIMREGGKVIGPEDKSIQYVRIITT